MASLISEVLRMGDVNTKNWFWKHNKTGNLWTSTVGPRLRPQRTKSLFPKCTEAYLAAEHGDQKYHADKYIGATFCLTCPNITSSFYMFQTPSLMITCHWLNSHKLLITMLLILIWLIFVMPWFFFGYFDSFPVPLGTMLWVSMCFCTHFRGVYKNAY